ncbi:hypothetical protein PG990_007559 [Apiospora arundinis]
MASYYDYPPPRDRGYDYGGPPPVSAADPYYPDPAASNSRRPRRGSILVDPAERDRGGPHRRHRSQSQVRLQEPEFDDSSDDDDARYHHSSSKPRSGGPAADPGRKVKHRDGRVEYVPEDAGAPDRKMSSARRPKPRTRVSDLEEKDGPQYRDFRARRNGFEAEEGRTHRNLKSSRGDRAIYDDGDDNDPYGLGGPGGGPPGRDAHAPPPPSAGSRSRGGPDPYDVALGAGVGAAGAAAARSGRRHEEPRRPRDRPPPTYHDDVGDRGYTSDAPKSRRNKDRSARQSLPPDYNRDKDRGDRYGGAPPLREEVNHLIHRVVAPRRPRLTRDRRPTVARDTMRHRRHLHRRRGVRVQATAEAPVSLPNPVPVRSGSTRHGPRGGAEEKSRARSAAYPQDPYNDFNDRRGGGGRHHPRDPRAPYEEVADPRRPRGGASKGSGGRGAEAVKKERTVPPWAKKAGGFLVSTAVPIIKQEGEKYLRKEMERRFQK